MNSPSFAYRELESDIDQPVFSYLVSLSRANVLLPSVEAYQTRSLCWALSAFLSHPRNTSHPSWSRPLSTPPSAVIPFQTYVSTAYLAHLNIVALIDEPRQDRAQVGDRFP